MTVSGDLCMKRLFSLFLAFLLLVPALALSELDEDELFIEEWIDVDDPEDSLGIVETDGSRTITITCTGDLTIGGDNYHHKGKVLYDELKKHDDNISFTMENVRDIFKKDDLTLINFEGTLTNTTSVPKNKHGNEFLFNIDPKYVTVLTDNYVEAVSLANNHVMDHGTEGYEDTKQTLIDAGVVFSTEEDIGLYQIGDTVIAMLSYLCIDRYGKPYGDYATFEEKVCADISRVKQEYPLVIVSFHWGLEPTKTQPSRGYKPTDNQLRMGRMAVDAGADLVVGHHSHRVQPIECYKGVYICYSLGNFCFAGNDKPRDMNSIIFQTRFRVTKSGEISNTGFRIIPIRITSLKDKNNYVPTPITDESRIEGIISTMKDNGKDYGVAEYPLEWE